MSNPQQPKRTEPQDLNTLAMASRAGRSTNSNYLVFQDKDKHKDIQPKVQTRAGLEFSDEPKLSAEDKAIKDALDKLKKGKAKE